jgi:hypothetical protein
MENSSVHFYVQTVAIAFAVAELVFYVYVRYFVYPKILPLRTPPKPALEPVVFIERVISHIVALDSYDSREFFRGLSIV